MKKAVIFGLGNEYAKLKDLLRANYEIVAVTDNFESCRRPEMQEKYISPVDINQIEFDVVIICTSMYYDTIRYQLEKQCKIPAEKVMGIHNGVEEDYQKTLEEMKCYQELEGNVLFSVDERELYLISHERDCAAGRPPKHYFAQDIWGAKKIFKQNPEKHLDIGSRLDGFIGHLLAFREEVHYVDIRPLPYEIAGLKFIQGDATNLEMLRDNSVESLSSFHAVEHFGLGRYGDSIDPQACFKALRAFQRVLQPGGHLYLGLPIGPQDRLVFNAHRIFNPKTVIETLKGLKLVDFCIVPGDSSNSEKIGLEGIESIIPNIPDYSCGLFEFIK